MVEYALQGDLDAFNRLVLAYQDIAYNVAYRVLGERTGAEDAVQDAFLSAYRKLKTYRGGSFKAWLLRIVTNACYDELRRQKRRPTVALQPTNTDDEEIESPAWLEDPGESPEEAALRVELSNAIQHCLDGLDTDFRVVVVMVDIQGMDYAEAAEAVSSPLGTIKSRLARARARLQDCLRGFGELLPGAFRLDGERISK
ncbi:sigma-70 family RNA polymerase sigma factor [bacterium]|nr:sigma-70 family RNA polymerase sigma factor [bacterium]MCB2179140.1 sigma-70 family RNA polymerase sigma factor [bacterium]